MTSTNDIVTLLGATLSPDTNLRIAAELQLSQALSRPDAALSLAQVVVTREADLALRQMSWTIVLRKYVREHWSPFFSTFRGNAATPAIKDQIRQAIFLGLSDPTRKIRSLSAQTLSLIANSDWPDEYPNLLNDIIALLSTNSPDAVHGAMAVFTEFIKSDLSEDQILPVLRQLLPVLLNILGDQEHHTALTRARTISVFRQCVSALYMVKEMHPQAIKEATDSVLPVWLEAFKVLLSQDPAQDVASHDNWDRLSIRIQIFKTLDILHTSFARALKPYLSEFLSASLHHLQAYFPTYTQFYLVADASVPKNSEDESVELPEVAAPILDFISAIARGGRAKDWFGSDQVAGLVQAIFAWSQISIESEETWSTSADAFINEEGDSSESYSVRVAGFDLLMNLVERKPLATTEMLSQTIHATVQEANAARDSGDKHWWRRLEAALAAVGSQAESVMECITEEVEVGKPKPLDIEGLLANVVPSLLRLQDCPFLQGRAFVFASQFARLLPAELGAQYLEAAVQVIEAQNAGVPIKVSAIKAIQNFAQALDNSALTQFAPRIVGDLGPFMLATSEDTLLLVLETMSVCIEIDGGSWLTSDLAKSVTSAALQVWTKTNKDPMFTSVLSDVLQYLAGSRNAGVYTTVVQEALPPLANATATGSDEQSWIAETALELITGIVNAAQEGQLGDGFFATVAPSLFDRLRSTEDRDTIQNGVVCLTSIIQKDCSQVLAWRDSAGVSGLDNVLAVIAKLLHDREEAGSLFIGDLVIHLLRKSGDAVLPALPGLLQAMVTRMTTVKSDLFLESLLTPFAYLLYHQRDAVLTTLEGMNIEGQSGLHVLINKWCEHPDYKGLWQSRINVLALTNVYASDRPVLQAMPVRGEMIIKPTATRVIMTRSRTKQTPIEWTSIPFPIKALKMILADLQIQQTNAAGAGAAGTRLDDVDIDSDDDDEDWTAEERAHQGFTAEEFGALSEMLGPRGVNFDNDDEPVPDEIDFAGDPILSMDMAAHIQNFIRECATKDATRFSQVVNQLNAEETVLVRSVLSA